MNSFYEFNAKNLNSVKTSESEDSRFEPNYLNFIIRLNRRKEEIKICL